jgi:hypothetical protein bfra3_02378
MKNIILTILALCLSCTDKTTKSDKSTIIRFLPSQEENTAPMSDVFTIKKYVPLEVDDETLIGDISKLITTVDKYIIFDNVSMRIFIFDRETGKKVGIIEAIGQGPQEYITIWDIAYVENSDEILILSPKKLLVYSTKGEFKKAEKVALLASNIAMTTTHKAIIYANYSENTVENKEIKDNLLLLGSDYQVEKTYMPFTTMVNSFVRINPLVNNGDYFLYYNKVDDKLYEFNKEETLNATYTLDYGNNNSTIATKILSALESDKMMSADKSTVLEKEYRYCNLLKVLNTPSYLFFIYNQNEYFHYAFYNKNDGKVKQFTKKYTDNTPPIPLINDFDGVSYYPLLSNEKNTFVSYALSDELMETKGKSNKKLELLRPDLKEDNFVIVEFEIKN